MFLVPTLLLLQAWTGMPDRLWVWTSKLAGLTAATLVFVLVYVMASGIPFDPGRYKQHVIHTLDLGTTTTGLFLRYPATLTGYASQARDLSGYLVDVMSWPLLIAAGVGIALALRRDRRSLLLLLSPLGFFLILIPVRFCKIHYLIPVALPLTFFAAYAFEQGLRARREIRLFAGAAAAGVAVLMLLQIVDLTHDMLHDSRYAAGIWLDQNTHRGDRIIDFAPDMRNPALRADIHLIKVDRRELSLSTIEEAQPEFLLIIPDDTDQDRNRVEWRYGPHAIHSDYLSEEAYGKLVDGSLGYRLVAQFQSPRLFPWLNRPFLSYCTVNPPIQIFARQDRAVGAPELRAWEAPPYYPKYVRVHELTTDRLAGRVR
jgi:hypothetical protein